MLSPICEMEVSNEFGMRIQEIVTRQVSMLNQNALYLVGIVFVMWLLQPVFNNFVEKHYPDDDERLQVIYKWLGLGMLFIAGLLLVYVNWVL